MFSTFVYLGKFIINIAFRKSLLYLFVGMYTGHGMYFSGRQIGSYCIDMEQKTKNAEREEEKKLGAGEKMLAGAPAAAAMR